MSVKVTILFLERPKDPGPNLHVFENVIDRSVHVETADGEVAIPAEQWTQLVAKLIGYARREAVSDCLRIAKEHVTPSAYEAMRRLLEECG